MSEPRVDVLVAGGGPAGLATAMALKASGVSVLVVEASGYREFRAGEHLDSSALPLLRRLGLSAQVWELDSLGCPGVLSRWGGTEEAFSSTLLSPFGDGRILSRPAFDARFADAAAAMGVGFVTARLGAVERPTSHDPWRVALRRRGSVTARYQARFLVDATGRGAHLARLLGVRTIRHDPLVGIVGWLGPTKGHATGDACLRIEAMASGWWYAAPLLDGRLVATFMTDADLLGAADATPRRVWQENFKASESIRQRAASHHPEPDLKVRSAHSQRLGRVCGQGWLAVGDAAISFDPLSSAGMRKGLELGLLAADAIRDHLEGDHEALAHYEHQVRARFEDYLSTRAFYYRLENRWPEMRFWARRQAPLQG